MAQKRQGTITHKAVGRRWFHIPASCRSNASTRLRNIMVCNTQHPHLAGMSNTKSHIGISTESSMERLLFGRNRCSLRLDRAGHRVCGPRPRRLRKERKRDEQTGQTRGCGWSKTLQDVAILPCFTHSVLSLSEKKCLGCCRNFISSNWTRARLLFPYKGGSWTRKTLVLSRAFLSERLIHLSASVDYNNNRKLKHGIIQSRINAELCKFICHWSEVKRNRTTSHRRSRNQAKEVHVKENTK